MPPIPGQIKILMDYYDAYTKNPPKHLLFIRQARVRALKEDKALLNWSLSPLYKDHTEVDKALIETLEAIGGDIRSGTAPPDPMERQLQKDIDALAKRLGKGKGKGKTD